MSEFEGPRRAHLQSYGRRRGRRLRANQERLLREALPRYEIRMPSAAAAIDPRTLFEPRPAAVWLEIGFGGGEHLAAQARARPDIGFIGAEPFVNGVVALLARIEAGGIANIRLWPDDVRKLLPAFAPGSIGRVFVLFPDPWPKARHHKRRLVSTALLATLATVMAEGAELILASDDRDYIDWMVAAAASCPDLEPIEDVAASRPPGEALATRYERKALTGNRVPVWLGYRRRPRAGGGHDRENPCV